MQIHVTISFLLVLLFHSFEKGYSQNVSLLTGNVIGDYNYWKISETNSPLFNHKEISDRKIRHCYILMKTMDGKGSFHIDTQYVFRFDKNGNTELRINVPYSDTILYNASQKVVDSSIRFQNGTKEVTRYYSWAFNYESEEIDTGYISRHVYDSQNRLIEYQHFGTHDYHAIYFCGTGITIHEKYGYDQFHRITSYENLHARSKAQIRHYGYWRHIRVEKSRSKSNIRYKVFVRKDQDQTVEKDDFSYIKLIRLAKGSTLLARLVTRDLDGSKFKEYIFLYDYNEITPPQMTAPFYTVNK